MGSLRGRGVPSIFSQGTPRASDRLRRARVRGAGFDLVIRTPEYSLLAALVDAAQRPGCTAEQLVTLTDLVLMLVRSARDD